ncbi:cell division protein SufI [Bisgaardia hudsonensis]|uniref:Cell division protein FtsP n=1 Tax=Bisgaardia hudsonensis TaxID=109472 RepID=A0A4R2N0G0_9PAST|nr:multicopper oxidase domain-containing protein [Bisgaardia hudsonensis]QLB13462.1 cell division protein FtsQ [Bisgaardia hudsonensis]TCP12871.1 cell division protein SufI [Bisgaardia hudsonensis]
MLDISRRQLIKTAGVTTILSMIPTPLIANSRIPLKIPPLIDLHRGKPAYLNIDVAQAILSENTPVEVWGINGNYLGPTFKIRQDDFAKITYKNNLNQNVSINIQGLQTSGELIGGMTRVLKTNETWSPIIQINQPASTCWYHSCSLGNSAYQTYRGIAGMYIIEDKESRHSQLPQKYGINDIPLILQDLQLNTNGVQLFQQNRPHFYGNRLFVNGKENPYIVVEKELIRLRLVNASLSRVYDLHFDDDREFKIIAQDQGFLPQAKIATQITLSPSERVEILVDMSNSEKATLITGKKQNFFNRITQVFQSSDNFIDNTVLEIQTKGLASAFNNKKHFQFNTDSATIYEHKGIKERSLHIDTKTGLINGKLFNPRRVDITAKLGSTEKWTITSSSPIGFKIQGAKFIIETINDQPLPDNEKCWKDSLWIDQKITILIKFENRSSNNYPFTFGSSDLMLADKGCLGVLVVQ